MDNSSNVDGFIFDMDGTVYLGDNLLPGAAETINSLRSAGKQVRFVTNKPLEPRENYALKLTKLGIPTPPEDIITSGYAMGYYISKHHPGFNLYVIGEDNLKEELRGHGLSVMDEFDDQDEKDVIDPTGIDAVVVAFDRTLNYRKINTAYQALLNGALFFATNPDKMCPMPGGGIPDAGFTITGLEHLTGRKVDVLAGKPSSVILGVIADEMNLPASKCMMIGDRLETDIYMGQKAGMITAVVLTGASTREDAESLDQPPDFILGNIGELLDATVIV